MAPEVAVRVAVRRKLDPRLRIGVAGLVAVAASIGLAQTARAEVRLHGESGGNYQVNVMSWWEIPFRSVVRQRFDFSCGSAAIATLLTHHYDRPTPEQVAFREMWNTGNREAIRKVGFSMFDMKKYLVSVGLPAEGYRLTVDELAALERPSIVLLDLKGFKHFVVVKGVHGDRILVGDPMLGLNQYSKADFAKVWNGIALAISKPGEVKPRYNLANDWGPWSKAPMEDGAMKIGAYDLTTNLPPTYQITPQIILDVPVGTVR